MIAADSLGDKLLYYYHEEKNGFFAYSSELKAILAISTVPREIDREALGVFLRSGSITPPHSLIKGARKVLPGQRVSIASSGQIARKRYWQIQPVEKGPNNIEYWAPRVREEVLAAAERISRRTPDLGLSLSGGVDSTVMLAALQELGASRCVAFTVGFEGPKKSLDLAWATTAAANAGVEHYAKAVNPQEVTAELLMRMLRQFDEPIDSGSRAISQYFMTLDMKTAGIRGALSGAHGEQVLGGISWPRRLRRLEEKTPETAGQDMAYRSALIRNNFFTAAEQRAMTGDEFDVDQLAADLSRESRPRLETLSDFENQTNGILMGSGMGRVGIFVKTISPLNDVEQRSGFLDRKLVEFAQTIPPLLRGSESEGGDQRLLINAAFKHLAPTIMEPRDKQAFPSSPWHDGFAHLEPLIVRQAERIGASGFLNSAAVGRVLRKYRDRGIQRDFTNVWMLCVLQTWLDFHIDGVDPLSQG